MSERRSLPGAAGPGEKRLIHENARTPTQRRDGPLQRVVDGPVYPFFALGASLVAWGLWYQNPSRGWALALALAPPALRLLAGRRPLPRTPVDLPLALFLLTAGFGVWAAYDRTGTRAIFGETNPTGRPALWGLTLSAALFYALAALESRAGQRRALAFWAAFGAGIALWFAAAHDWAAEPAKLALVTRAGIALQRWLPPLPNLGLDANSTARIVAPFLPLSLGLAVDGWRRRRRAWTVWGLATAALLVPCLLLTTSRGAALGLAGGLALTGGWRLAGRTGGRQRQLGHFVALAGLGALALVATVALLPPLRRSAALANRLDIFAETALLVRDAPFTGFGLGEFPLVHSTYALLIHVPILPHAHSLYLDAAASQGLLGALAAVGISGGAAVAGLRALARAETPRPLLAAALVALAVASIHDLVDDPLYYSFGAPLLWVPAGSIVAGAASKTRRRGLNRRAAAVALAATAIFLALFWRPLAAAWYANLGAVAQARVELNTYDPKHFDAPTLDQIRARADLSTAEGYFERALALNPGQVTARTRLAQIALGRGQYQRALAHARAARAAGARDRVTRLILGDALVATGQVEAAVETVRGLEWAEGRLDGQAWYRYWVGGDYRRAADAWRAVVLLNPQNQRAADAMAAAEERAQHP